MNLDNVKIKAEVLISDGWVSKLPILGFKRAIGQQITRWSCFPASIEIASYLIDKKDTRKQELLKDLDIKWQKKNGETRWFMPYNNSTFHKILDKMDMAVLDILNESEIKKAIKKNAFGQKKDEAWILCFHRFALPNKFNGIEVNHATVLYDTRNTIKLVVPAYNRKFEYNKDTIFEYKDWKEILKREPVYAIKITRRGAINPETKKSVLSKFKIFWL